MSSFGNAIENWSRTGDISDLQHKLVSDGCARSSSPIKAIAAVVDSAYSSFSGSSYVTDYHPFHHGSCHLNDEQTSYMDSEYVKAIYNPSAADQINFQQNSTSEDSLSKTYRTSRISKLNNSQVTLIEDHSPVTRINNYTPIQQFEQCDINRESGDQFSHKTKRSPTSDFSSPEHKHCRHYIEDHSPLWVRDSTQNEWNQLCVTSSNREKEDYPHLTSSSFLSPVGNLSKIHNGNNSPTHESVVNIDCNEQKDLWTIQQSHVKKEEQNPSTMFSLSPDYYTNEGISSKSTRRSIDDLVSEKIEFRSGSWKSAQETNCYNDEGTKCEETEDLAHNQMYREQYLPKSQNMKDLECDNVGQWDSKYKSLYANNSQIQYSRPSADMFEPPSKALNHDNVQKVSKTHIRKDATIKPIPLLSQDQELTMPLTYFCELPSEKITKASTPMLYHLAGGKNSSLAMLSGKNQPKPLDTNQESNTFSTANSTTSQVVEQQKTLNKTKSHSQLIDNSISDCSECETFGNLTSSEESFMYDYREKLKVAQKKVLRETSFKRKDLQMSLPVRLKWNAPKRPTIDHIRSYSLSSTNEETKIVQPKTLVDINYKTEEPKMTVISRIGGRKRLTKEQRKLCYSEPEKLDHVGVQNSFSVWNKEGSSQAKIGEHQRMKSTDKERTLSTSNLSKTELKQIQHNALVEYMERKANQRPSSVHQSQLQKQSGIKSSSEWKCLTNDTSSNDLLQPSYHRRSSGASSSYDATVTWNDRFIRMSQGDHVNLMDKPVNEKTKTYIDQSLKNYKCYFEDSSAIALEKNPKYHPQAPAGNLSSSTSALLSSNHASNRLSVTVDNTAQEKEEACTSRGRGKSMEELGISERIRLSVLSQSSEQLYNIRGAALGPQSGNVSGTAVVHQDKLKSSPEPERLPTQTSTKDLLGPHRSDTSKSAHERHSRPPRTSGASPGLDDSSSSPSQLYPGKTEQSHSLQTDNEVFSPTNTINLDDVYSPPNVLLEKTGQMCHLQELPQANDPLLINCSLHQQAMSVHKPSLETNEKNVSWCDNEVRVEVNDPLVRAVIQEANVSIEEGQNFGSVNEESKSANVLSTSNRQENNVDTSQEDGTKIGSSFIHDKSPSSGQEPCIEEQDDTPRENLTRSMLRSHAEERYTELVKEITAKDKSLADVLKPLPARESAINLMKSLFSVDFSTRERSRNQALKNKLNIEGLSKSHIKTLALEKTCSQNPNGDEIALLKDELMSNITLQLEELCGERELLLSEISENTSHGTNIEAVVKEVCKPNEYERYMMFIGDLEKVVSLLFCLSMRLTRVENALSKIDKNADAEEMQSLKERHSLLSRQREDAKDLKDNLDRREQVVTGILAKYLSKTQLEDYKHFVRLKTSFLIEQKDLDEQIKFHEEQLESLHTSIPP
ncbi:protein Shroom1 [Engystomops pustulosus]|uniref:protein Shroom1 n=1 Tax=Engystomops pustulosus TaxID=76066 RepID=UPI003AFABAE5